MPYFRVDDRLHDHRKSRAARRADDGTRTAAPIGLWVLAGSWCMANLTDGFVPADELDRWDSDGAELAQQLVDAELWHPAERDGEPGFQFHEWDEWQHTASYIEKRRRDAANRMRRRRANQAAEQPDEPVTSDNTHAVRSSREHGGTFASPQPNPTTKNTREQVALVPDDFDRFWSSYPKKVGKKAAEKAWEKARRDETADTILAGLGAAVAAWRACGTEPRFIPNPSTWLNQGRWADEQQLPADSSTTPAPLPVDPDDPEPDPRAEPDAHLAWRKRRAAQRQGVSA